MAIDADDATLPLDNDAVNYPASAGAGEFRALKAKLNEVFLLSGVEGDAEFLVSMNGKSWYASVTGTPVVPQVMYGHSANIHRTGGTQATVGGQFQAYLANGVTGTDGVFGFIGSAIHGDTNSHGPLTGGYFGVYGRDVSNTADLRGIQIHFSDRIGAVTPVSGLGVNKYNNKSVAIFIDSDQRGTAGEYCGWSRGIVFDEYSMDISDAGRGACIDTYALHYDAGGLPSTDYRVDAVIRMATGQSILWDTVSGKMRITGGTIFGPLIGFWHDDTLLAGVSMTGGVYIAQFAGGGDRNVRVDNTGFLYAV